MMSNALTIDSKILDMSIQTSMVFISFTSFPNLFI